MVAIPLENADSIIKRLKRAQGQLGAVVRMLEEGRDCEETVTQLAAANKAIDKAGYALIAAGLNECYRSGENSDIDLAKLEKIFLSIA
jgi:DNA-binding FrmR family transcriptional regulator